jgi:hypothetical protein
MPLRPRTVVFLILGACAGASPPSAASPTAPEALLEGEGPPAHLSELVQRSPLTVLLFFDSSCPVQKAHDARLRELVTAYEPKGVSMVAIVSEVGADLAADRTEARRRAIPIPLLQDRGAALADALGVEYSTHVVLLDRERRVHYSGAFDSDRTHLTPEAEPYLREAIDATLAGKDVPKSHVEPLGCPLRKH